MELHRATKTRLRFLHRFDGSIARARNHYKTMRDAVDRLMMTRIHAVEAFHCPMQPSLLRPLDFMREGVGLRIAVASDVR